ncbi:MAG: hypothetical protein GY841_15950 [FCB group bacterium]|nr:hypothetical protein [FCB group bacterium]
MQCPNCGEDRIKKQTWQDDIWGAWTTVETFLQCSDCGWTYHNSYGHTAINGVPETPDEIDEYGIDGVEYPASREAG